MGRPSLPEFPNSIDNIQVNLLEAVEEMTASVDGMKNTDPAAARAGDISTRLGDVVKPFTETMQLKQCYVSLCDKMEGTMQALTDAKKAHESEPLCEIKIDELMTKFETLNFPTTAAITTDVHANKKFETSTVPTTAEITIARGLAEADFVV
ncbi:hypothetical protein LTR08_002431 [Meristemomyces frigidus]|nr:hypothetical protein LTR08_002431 [Meristemomyces frigidus]